MLVLCFIDVLFHRVEPVFSSELFRDLQACVCKTGDHTRDLACNTVHEESLVRSQHGRNAGKFRWYRLDRRVVAGGDCAGSDCELGWLVRDFEFGGGAVAIPPM